MFIIGGMVVMMPITVAQKPVAKVYDTKQIGKSTDAPMPVPTIKNLPLYNVIINEIINRTPKYIEEQEIDINHLEDIIYTPHSPAESFMIRDEYIIEQVIEDLWKNPPESLKGIVKKVPIDDSIEYAHKLIPDIYSRKDIVDQVNIHGNEAVKTLRDLLGKPNFSIREWW